LIKIIILEENFKWHLEAFASELYVLPVTFVQYYLVFNKVIKTLPQKRYS